MRQRLAQRLVAARLPRSRPGRATSPSRPDVARQRRFHRASTYSCLQDAGRSSPGQVAVQVVVHHHPGARSQAPRQTIGSSVNRPSAVVSPGPMPRRSREVSGTAARTPSPSSSRCRRCRITCRPTGLAEDQVVERGDAVQLRQCVIPSNSADVAQAPRPRPSPGAAARSSAHRSQRRLSGRVVRQLVLRSRFVLRRVSMIRPHRSTSAST